MKELFEFIKRNITSYLIVIIIAPLVYIALDFVFNQKVSWFGVIASPIIGSIVYTFLKSKDTKKVESYDG